MLVTTAYEPSESLLAAAERLAQKWQATYVPRRTDALLKIWQRYGAKDLLVVTRKGTMLYKYGHDPLHPLFFHPGMSALRIERLEKGEQDRMLAATDCKRGDRVLDCTAGLGADAIVFAYQVGENGQVIALESEAAVAAVAEEGLAVYKHENPRIEEAMRRIDYRHTPHLPFLQSLEDKSFDIVYFDPMFRQPIEESEAITPLRAAANSSALMEETVKEACRVARKRVVLKETGASGEFQRLGFEVWNPKRSTGSAVEYGVIFLS